MEDDADGAVQHSSAQACASDQDMELDQPEAATTSYTLFRYDVCIQACISVLIWCAPHWFRPHEYASSRPCQFLGLGMLIAYG